MLKFMLDTDICIYTIKNRPAGLRERFNAETAHMCVSAVTAMELFFGAEKSARPVDDLAIVESFLARLPVLPFNDLAAGQAGEIRASLERKGTPIGAYDIMIAGHARSLGLTVVTNNLREFGRIDGLRAETWV